MTRHPTPIRLQPAAARPYGPEAAVRLHRAQTWRSRLHRTHARRTATMSAARWRLPQWERPRDGRSLLRGLGPPSPARTPDPLQKAPLPAVCRRGGLRGLRLVFFFVMDRGYVEKFDGWRRPRRCPRPCGRAAGRQDGLCGSGACPGRRSRRHGGGPLTAGRQRSVVHVSEDGDAPVGRSRGGGPDNRRPESPFAVAVVAPLARRALHRVPAAGESRRRGRYERNLRKLIVAVIRYGDHRRLRRRRRAQRRVWRRGQLS